MASLSEIRARLQAQKTTNQVNPLVAITPFTLIGILKKGSLAL
jgi:hypothetical protein